MSSRRTFTAEYKREYAEQVIKHGYQAKEAANAMNAGLPSLQKWLRQYRNELNGIAHHLKPLEESLKRR